MEGTFAVARSQSNGAWKFVGAAAVAIVGGIAIGYLVGGARSPRTGDQIAQPPPPAISTPVPSIAPTVQHPRTANGDYTAPGAPRIAIHEESTPILHRVTQNPPPADAEATQEAPPVAPPKPSRRTSDAGNSGSPPPPEGEAGSTPPAANSGGTDGGGTAPAGTDAGAAPPTPADPDFERVGKPADPESGQERGGKAQFRVQTGSYTDESHARSVADELRGKGYSSSTRSEREGDHVIYKVQVGAYRSKAGAGKAAEDLQKQGYPAYVSPISP